MSYQKDDPTMVHIPLYGSVADPAHLVRYGYRYKDAMVACHGTKWTRLLLWFLKRAIQKHVKKGIEIHGKNGYAQE